jgi:cell division transport system ATP-binding protein
LIRFGENVTDLPRRPIRASAPHRHRVPGLPPLDHLTTGERVSLAGAGKSESDYREDVTDLLRWVGLGDRINAYPEILSGGEKQRAAIARAVIGRPELLLADEPTGNVDPVIADRLLRLFVELNRLGTSVIIATHDYGLMDQLDAPRLVLYEGHLEIR